MKQTADESAYWSEARSAHFAGLAKITLKVWRLKGRPIAPVYRFGRRVMYRATDIQAWAAAQCATPPAKVAP